MRSSRRIAIGLLASIAIAYASVGCGGDAPTIDATTLPAPTFGDATIRGTVRFVGDAPELKMIDRGQTCREASPIQEESIVVSRAGGLRDVIVCLTDAPASSGASLPPPTLDQVGCRYEPHVLAVQVGQPLRIRSSDAEFHNVHWVGEANPSENLGFTRAGESKLITLERPEFLRLRCDIHGWMESFVGVMPNPFFATTDRDGTFTIEKVPAGTYHATAWHALLGTRTGTVTVSASGTATLDFEYARATK